MFKLSRSLLYIVMILVSSIATSMYTIVVAWVLYEISGNAFYSGMLIGVGFLPGLLFNLFFGVFVDRFNRWKIALAGFSVSSLVFLVFTMTILTNVMEVWMILLFHAVIQLMNSMNRPALQAYLTQLFSRDQYAKMIGLSSSLSELGWIAGVSIAGFLLVVLGDAWMMGFIFFISLLALLCLSLLKSAGDQHEMQPIPHQSMLSELKNGFGYLLNHTTIAGMMIIGFVGQLVLHSNTGLLPVYTSSYLGESSHIFGLLEGTLSTGAIAAGVAASWALRKLKYWITVYANLTMIAGVSLLSFSHSVHLSFLGIFLIGIGTTLLRVSTQSIQQMLTEPLYHGRMASYRMVMNQGSVVIASPILGFVSESHGANAGYMILLIPLICVFMYSMIFLRRNAWFAETAI
ncbi:transmembrane secretion effector [Melghiribacillus thermohalophilus]|uniref:Transmembrane secretion effector n=1 Tax=Melghiribacillus thermohalophilus TaxID=1324956 RepID=A0A4R3MV32_9BACI|nr:MFS transporter [Melghiribacillus thermohalophilus]TCT19356.1 transmembrane secretion effector [Melghiribacillus thermohalophilus]